MTASDIDPSNTPDGSYSRTKQSELTFTATENGKTSSQTIIVNQTNKALTIDDKKVPEVIKNPSNSSSKTHPIASNAKWKFVAQEPSTANAFTNITIDAAAFSPSATTTYGSELYDGTAQTFTLAYTIQSGATISRYSKLTFTDSESPKRFDDVVLSIYQCSNIGKNPTLSEWATLAGFSGVRELPDTSLSDAENKTIDDAAGINIPNPTTGIAWHRDQNGNVFLSSSFDPTDVTGNNERWMITNLNATKFDPNRTGASDNTIVQPFYPSPSGALNIIDPLWAYPKTTGIITIGEAAPSTYTDNPRIGLLYNWAAATNSRGGSTGSAPFTDGENTSTPQTAIIQGICPEGWHLPSDAEWTALERIINENTMIFSSATTNANGTITTGSTGGRGSHGLAMLDECEPGTPAGLSNPISTVKRPGFEVLLAGYAYNGTTSDYRSVAEFWSASAGQPTEVWAREFKAGTSQVKRNPLSRNYLFSIRCKK